MKTRKLTEADVTSESVFMLQRRQILKMLGISAGHDLNRDNLTDFLRAVPGVQEVSIGHALIADALELGYTETVRDYQRCIQRAFAPR